ncbi:MAG: ABC transporter transmembrane domain-containing protein, partial [Planctomycetaceae bacterium]
MAPAIAELLVRRWFGDDAASASELVIGVGALAAARAGAIPPLEEAETWVRGEAAAGRDISIFAGDAGGGKDEVDMERVSDEDMAAAGFTPPPKGAAEAEPEPEPEAEPEPPAQTEGPPPAAAASFVAFLIEQTDRTSLKRYFEAFTPARRDEAANAVFRRPLANLEEQWQKSMGAQKTRPGMLGFFKFLAPLLKPQMWSYIETVVYMVIAAIFGVVIPLVTGCLVSALAEANAPAGGPEPGGLCGVVAPTLSADRLLIIVAILVVIYLVEQGMEIRRALVEATLYNNIGLSLRQRMFGHLLKLSHRFYGDARVGDVASRLSNDLDTLQAGVQQVFSGGVFMFLMSTIAGVTALLK